MSFEDSCSCHVWAIDGYTDDEIAYQVNDIYAKTAMNLMSKKASKAKKLAALVEAARVTPPTVTGMIIYGGWQVSGEGAPEHMWIECEGYIYDTMPGHPLRRKVASEATRFHPGCEEAPFKKNKVAWVESTLTLSQFKILQAAKWHDDAYMP